MYLGSAHKVWSNGKLRDHFNLSKKIRKILHVSAKTL